MKIIGCDFHPSVQQIAIAASETGRFSSRCKRWFHQRYSRKIAGSDRWVEVPRQRDEVAPQCAANAHVSGFLKSYNEPKEAPPVGGMP